MKSSQPAWRRTAAKRTATALALVTAFSAVAAAIDLREPAPRFSGKTLDGESFNNETLKGKVVLVQFWTTWCRYCRGDQDAIDSVVRDFGNKGLVVLAVDVGESKKKVKRYLEESPRVCKVVLTEDTNLAAVFAAKSFPQYVLIGRDGAVAATHEGAAREHGLLQMLKKVGLTVE
jgi:thiol-disulfide isomerase/thioredoxin